MLKLIKLCSGNVRGVLRGLIRGLIQEEVREEADIGSEIMKITKTPIYPPKAWF